MQVKKQQLEPDMEQWAGFKWWKEYVKVCQVLSLSWFNLYAEYIVRNAKLDEAKPESRLPGEISTSSYRQMTPP